MMMRIASSFPNLQRLQSSVIRTLDIIVPSGALASHSIENNVLNAVLEL